MSLLYRFIPFRYLVFGDYSNMIKRFSVACPGAIQPSNKWLEIFKYSETSLRRLPSIIECNVFKEVRIKIYQWLPTTHQQSGEHFKSYSHTCANDHTKTDISTRTETRTIICAPSHVRANTTSQQITYICPRTYSCNNKSIRKSVKACTHTHTRTITRTATGTHTTECSPPFKLNLHF